MVTWGPLFPENFLSVSCEVMSRWTSFNPEFPEQHPSHGFLSRSLGRDDGFALHVRPNDYDAVVSVTD